MQNPKPIWLIFISIVWGLVLCSASVAVEMEDFTPGEDSGFFYTIQKGDTLWDLSQKFYNSEWDWPGLWEMNDEIKNPHWIYPGKKIRIFLKNRPMLPPKVVDVQKAQPEETPEPIRADFSYAGMDHIGFLRSSQQPSLGRIIKAMDDNLMMSKGNIIFIKPSGTGTLVPGKTYHIFSTKKTSETIGGKRFSGIRHVIKAHIKIQEHKGDHATALITDSFQPAYKDDMIMEFYERDRQLTVNNAPRPIDARIICSEEDHLMINDYIIAFINKGRDSVKPGEVYSVKRRNSVKDNSLWPKTPDSNSVQLDDLESGKLIVLHTEDISATVMILSSKYPIHPDDIVN